MAKLPPVLESFFKKQSRALPQVVGEMVDRFKVRLEEEEQYIASTILALADVTPDNLTDDILFDTVCAKGHDSVVRTQGLCGEGEMASNVLYKLTEEPRWQTAADRYHALWERLDAQHEKICPSKPMATEVSFGSAEYGKVLVGNA